MWRHLPEIVSNPVVATDLLSADSVKQGPVGDCAFLSSLVALANCEEQTGKPILTKSIYPKERPDSLKPVVRPEGKYVIKLYFNGEARKVVLDDTVPTLTKRLQKKLTATSAPLSNQLWVTLFEKAYAKTMGGYASIDGSHAPDNLYLLSGWISEIVSFERLKLTGKTVDQL
ncbi:unnamed protein product [Vitrella brassicaformis CCMP3155]|uniref:Calpain catalytic domain-containing protein n=1 Tax=Vitrella brassicaformis (strain CCMP3155) TaxID=1169540 RepID=A0A0G4G1W2_VITBC|nr:unnamed protein product [Vitrella brassicaformis CCMP3155]|eukprot:CEM22047.1 unnamed protein product [Vitrella brassicaformis CCMP3155]